MHRFVLFIVGFVVSASTLVGQFNQNGPNAILRINTLIPSHAHPTTHDVTVYVPGEFEIEINSGANPLQPVVLLASPLDPVGPVITVPWGGSIDVGAINPANGQPVNIELAGDGFTGTDNTGLGVAFVTGRNSELVLAFGVVPAVAAGQQVAFQGIVRDPTNPPFLLDNTQAGDANFVFGQRVILPLGPNQISFLAGQTFNFHGVSHSDIFINDRGFVTFGGAPIHPADFGALNHNATWLTDRPSIAAHLARWNPTHVSPSNGVLYEESAGSARICWGDPAAQSTGGIPHLNDTDQNQFELTLQLDNGLNSSEGAFSIDLITLDQGTVRQFGSGLFGHTPGPGAIGGFDRDLHQPQACVANEAMLEEHVFHRNTATAGGFPVQNLGWNGSGGFRGYNQITRSWNGGRVNFAPVATTGLTGDQGYVSSYSGPLPPDDYQGTHVSVLDYTGGQTISLFGSFYGFDPNGDGSGTVTFDPEGNFGGPFPATIVGIRDSTGQSGTLAMPNPQPGPARDGQALVIMTPALAAPRIVPIEVSFDSGLVATTQQPMTDPTGQAATFTTYNGSIPTVKTHQLATPLTFGGTGYTQAFISPNGIISFTSMFIPTIATEVNFFGGGGISPGVSVAPFWTSLSSNAFGTPSTYGVLEDPSADILQFLFADLDYASAEPAGTIVVTFDTSIITSFLIFDYAAYIPSRQANQDVIIGISDGDSAVGASHSFTNGFGTGLFTALGSYSSAAPNESFAESIPENTVLPFTEPMYVLDLFSNFTWTLF